MDDSIHGLSGMRTATSMHTWNGKREENENKPTNETKDNALEQWRRMKRTDEWNADKRTLQDGKKGEIDIRVDETWLYDYVVVHWTAVVAGSVTMPALVVNEINLVQCCRAGACRKTIKFFLFKTLVLPLLSFAFIHSFARSHYFSHSFATHLILVFIWFADSICVFNDLVRMCWATILANIAIKWITRGQLYVIREAAHNLNDTMENSMYSSSIYPSIIMPSHMGEHEWPWIQTKEKFSTDSEESVLSCAPFFHYQLTIPKMSIAVGVAVDVVAGKCPPQVARPSRPISRPNNGAVAFHFDSNTLCHLSFNIKVKKYLLCSELTLLVQSKWNKENVNGSKKCNNEYSINKY